MSTLIKDKLSDFKNAYPELQFIYDVYDPEYKWPDLNCEIFKEKPEIIFYHFSNQFLRWVNPQGLYDERFPFYVKTEKNKNRGYGNLVDFAKILFTNQPFFKDFDIFHFPNVSWKFHEPYCCFDCGRLKEAIEEQRKEVREKAPEIIQDIAFGNTYEKGLLNLILN